jgi:hypothetical protein
MREIVHYATIWFLVNQGVSLNEINRASGRSPQRRGYQCSTVNVLRKSERGIGRAAAEVVFSVTVLFDAQ